MRNVALAGAFAALFAASLVSAEAGPRSASGPRGASGGVEVAPVDSLGPTLPAPGFLTSDSGWNGSGSAGVLGSGYSSAQPLFATPPAPVAPPGKHHQYIILNNGNAQ